MNALRAVSRELHWEVLPGGALEGGWKCERLFIDHFIGVFNSGGLIENVKDVNEHSGVLSYCHSFVCTDTTICFLNLKLLSY